MSINDEWVRYLRAEGYLGNINDMLRTALQSEAASSYKNLNDLWVAYLTSEGYTGNINDMMYQWLGAKGYTGSLNDRLLQALKADDIFAAPAISCIITLNADSAAGFGLSPAEITGQSFGVTSSSAATGYLASTPAASPTPLWGSGRRWIEIHDYSLSGTDGSASIRAGFARTDTYVSFVLRATSGISNPLRDIQLLDAAGAVIATVNPGAGTGDVGLGIDSSGNCFYDIGAGPVQPGGAFNGAFASSNIALLGIAAFANAAESADMAIRTNGADYTLEKHVTSDVDWCGNDTIPKFDPASLFGVGDVGDYWDFTDISTLYQDTLKTTPVVANNDVVGAAEGLRGTLDLTQGTTASKPLYKASPGGIYMTSGTTRAFLDVSLSGLGLTVIGNSTIGASGVLNTTASSQPMIELANSSNQRYIIGHTNVSTTNSSFIVGLSSATVGMTGPGLSTNYSIVSSQDNTAPTVKAVSSFEALSSVASPVSATAPSVLQVGKNTANSTVKYTGHLFRALYIHRPLTDTELQKVNIWLQQGYA